MSGPRTGKTQVVLLSMPYPPIDQPSMGLSLLKPALARAGIPARVLYPCLAFAEEIGLAAYAFIADGKQEFLAGEWTFAGAAFPDFAPDHEAYLDQVIAAPVTRGLAQRNGFEDDPRQALRRAREAAPGFVDRVARRAIALGPRIVGCTSTFMQHCASLAVLRRIRELAPEIVTVIGGANCEGPMGAAARRCFDWLDFVVSGEADLLFPELCRKLIAHGRALAPEELPLGVIGAEHPSVHGLGEAPRAVVEDMDLTPTPDFDDYFAELAELSFRGRMNPSVGVETSRGCWWGKKHHCTFCGLNGGGMAFRSKSADRVVEELRSLSQTYGVSRFNVVDNILDMSYLHSVLPRLAGEGPYTLFFETKSNLRRDQLQVMAEGGITRLQPGIEFMHDQILRLIDKGSTALMNVRLLKWAREIGVDITWNFLWDVPGEEDAWYEEMADWLALIVHLEPPGVDRIQFHRFSPYHSRPERYGLELAPFAHYASVYPVAAEDLSEMAYYFQDPRRRPAAEELVRRPGLKRMLRAVSAWKALWGQGGGRVTTAEPPRLAFRRTSEGIEIEDSRPCAPASRVLLTGVEAAVFAACDDIQAPAALAQSLKAEGRTPAPSAEVVAAALDLLVRRRLVLRLGDRCLGLALDADAPADAPRDRRSVLEPVADPN